jgi:Ca2+-transporting ATPase
MIFLGRLPLTALQILWMNLLTDAAPALALGWNPTDKDIMDRKPRDPKEQIITKRTIAKFISVGTIMCAGTLMAFLWGNPGSDPIKAQTLAFTTIIMFQMFYALSCRSEKSIFSVGLFSNKYLILAIVSSVLLQVAVVNLPFLQTVMQTTSLSLSEWLMITALASSILIISEISKYKR